MSPSKRTQESDFGYTKISSLGRPASKGGLSVQLRRLLHRRRSRLWGKEEGRLGYPRPDFALLVDAPGVSGL